MTDTTFPLGRCAITRGAQALLAARGMPGLATTLLDRHAAGDFGDLSEADRAANVEALRTGARVLSAYEVAGLRLWIITEADRSATTIMLPEEY
jgi:hypothetical protein